MESFTKLKEKSICDIDKDREFFKVHKNTFANDSLLSKLLLSIILITYVILFYLTKCSKLIKQVLSKNKV